jgi:hypothetical protein
LASEFGLGAKKIAKNAKNGNFGIDKWYVNVYTVLTIQKLRILSIAPYFGAAAAACLNGCH